MFFTLFFFFFFFFNDTASTEIYTLSLHDALPISGQALEHPEQRDLDRGRRRGRGEQLTGASGQGDVGVLQQRAQRRRVGRQRLQLGEVEPADLQLGLPVRLLVPRRVDRPGRLVAGLVARRREGH